MTSTLKTLGGIDLAGKDILVRVDFNVPVKNREVTDDTRIKAVLPTINKLLKAGSRIALLSHFGRPKGEVNPDYSLEVILPTLQKMLPQIQLNFSSDYIEKTREAFWANTPRGGIILCENLRFHPGEEKNDSDFAQKVAALGDLYVNDAFAACHRAHASIAAITRFIPAVAGELLASEISALNAYFINPERPLMAVIGGAKISSKIDVLKALLEKVDILAIGGGMANSFLKAQGYEIGQSLHEESALPLAQEIMTRAKTLGKKLLLPVDVVTATEFVEHADTTTQNITEVKKNESIFDIGPLTTALYMKEAEATKTLLWNGPLGAFEIKPFDRATLDFARKCVELTRNKKLISLTGGGDSVAALTALGLESGFSYVSTGGGAFLEFLEGKTLPGLAVLAQDEQDFRHPELDSGSRDKETLKQVQGDT